MINLTLRVLVHWMYKKIQSNMKKAKDATPWLLFLLLFLVIIITKMEEMGHAQSLVGPNHSL